MNLDWFKQIIYAFHPEASQFCDYNRGKCQQLQYLIRYFNAKDKRIFDLGTYFF